MIPNTFIRRAGEKGQGLLEYALILILITVIVIVVLRIAGPTIGNVFSQIIQQITSV